MNQEPSPSDLKVFLGEKLLNLFVFVLALVGLSGIYILIVKLLNWLNVPVSQWVVAIGLAGAITIAGSSIFVFFIDVRDRASVAIFFFLAWMALSVVCLGVAFWVIPGIELVTGIDLQRR